MEGGHSIDSSLGTLRMMHALGVRYLTLTHNENVPWADSATDEPVLGGLSDFGRDVVREMNRIGMLVDLSHVSADAMRDALAVATAPAIFSHSSARAAVRPSPQRPRRRARHAGRQRRRVHGDLRAAVLVSQAWADWYFECLDVVRGRGGDPRRFEEVDPVLEERMPLGPAAADRRPTSPTTSTTSARSPGSTTSASAATTTAPRDFPVGLEDVSGYPRAVRRAARRGWSEGDLAALGSGNVLRAMRDMETSPVGIS